jgi:ABC-type branched-subunit amino acid transport system ATPase component
VLERIRLQNFKTHRDTDIKLGRLTVLVGPNGSGKSSVLQAIELLAVYAEELTEPRNWSAMQARPNGAKPGPCFVEVTMSSSHEGLQPSWSFSLGHDPASSLVPWSEFLKKLDEAKNSQTPTPRPDFEEERRKTQHELSVVLLTLDPRRLAEPVPVSTVTPTLRTDGFGLADVLALMRLENDKDFQELQSALRAVVPQIERIWVRRTKLEYARPVARSDEDGLFVAHESDYQFGHELSFDVSGRRGISASMMSGGTLLTLGLLAILYSQGRPRILLIDDIDHGLHPRAQWDLLKQLRRLLEQFPDLQIIATSHSPDLVDELAPEEVVVTALREDGTSAAKSLAECPRSDLLGVLKSGQLWSAIGEDWVKDPAEQGT